MLSRKLPNIKIFCPLLLAPKPIGIEPVSLVKEVHNLVGSALPVAYSCLSPTFWP